MKLRRKIDPAGYSVLRRVSPHLTFDVCRLALDPKPDGVSQTRQGLKNQTPPGTSYTDGSVVIGIFDCFYEPTPGKNYPTVRSYLR